MESRPDIEEDGPLSAEDALREAEDVLASGDYVPHERMLPWFDARVRGEKPKLPPTEAELIEIARHR